MGGRHRARSPCPGGLEGEAVFGRGDRFRRRAEHAGLAGRCRVSRACCRSSTGSASSRRCKTGLGLDAADQSARASSTARTTSTPTCRPAIRSRNTSSRSSAAASSTLDMPDGATREIGITRLHLEQDAGKSLHDQHPTHDLCRSQPRRRRADGDRLRARSPERRGGRPLSAQIALDPALSRHLRRQHGGGLAALRLQRLGAPARRALRHALRDQERELGALCHAGDRVRGAPPDRDDRGGRHDRAADAALRRVPRRDPADALEGGGARLPLFPRPRPVAAGARRRRGSSELRAATAGIARREKGALCRRIRAVGPTMPACSSPSGRPREYFERGGARTRPKAGGELGHG